MQGGSSGVSDISGISGISVAVIQCHFHPNSKSEALIRLPQLAAQLSIAEGGND